MRQLRMLAISIIVLLVGITSVSAQRGLNIYFVDTEGGAATLIILPTGESVLIDTGSDGDRDALRIAKAAHDAGITRIDNLITTHWHSDHFGGVASLSKLIPIKRFYDRSIPDSLADDPVNFPTLMKAYKEASHGKSVTLNPGSKVPLRQPASGPELSLLCLCARGEVIPDRKGAKSNPLANENTPMPVDESDNAKSLGFLLSYGGFRFLDLGDLTWNIEYKLISPTNKIGLIDVYQSTHHGLEISNNPVLIKSVQPVVAIYNNGPHKGGHPNLTATLRSIHSVKAIYQAHRNLNAKLEENAPAAFIANTETEKDCKGEYIKLSLASNAKSYIVTVGKNGKPTRYQVRDNGMRSH